MIESESSDEEEEVSKKSDSLDSAPPNATITQTMVNSNTIQRDFQGPVHKRNASLDSISISSLNSSPGSPKGVQRLSGSLKKTARNSSPVIASRSPSMQSLTGTTAESGEDAEHKKMLQLYVFVARCIAYPFNARQPTDMARRQSKVTKQNLTAIKDRFLSFLEGRTNIIADEAFRNAVQYYYDGFLMCDRVHKMLNSGGYSSNDFREIFKSNIEKRVRSLPDIEGLSKETVLSSWMAKFDAIYRGDEDQKRTPSRLAATAASELILSNEQLYEMFQTILSVKKFEHQILYNACQLDNPDEQAACIRRELHSRQKAIDSMSVENMPKFIHKSMENHYREEQRAMIKELMSIHLEAFPIAKSSSENKSGFKKRSQNNNVISMMDVADDSDAALSKVVPGLVFSLQVTVKEASSLKSLGHSRIIFVVFELEGEERLRTDEAEAGRPQWDNLGEWNTSQPLPLLKLALMAEHTSKFHISEEKTIATLAMNPHPGMSGGDQWYGMVPYKGWTGDDVKIKLNIKMEKPVNVKYCGYLFAGGQSKWKIWKKRYFMLIQVSQYKFVMASYRERRAAPRELMVVEGYTVDFAEQLTDEEHKGGRFFFNLLKAGDEVLFACEEDVDRINWIYKLYTATGQSYKPAVPRLGQMVLSGSETFQKVKGDMDRATKHGMADLVNVDPFEFDQSEMFSVLQRLTLLHRLSDSYTCLGWFSPGQVFILDEYCARYGVRGCHRHLCYLADLLDNAENGIMIDPTLLHYSYAFCASHVVGNRPDGVNTITVDEKERFEQVKDRLRAYLANQITHFRYCFPFGRPEGALKSTLTLFERVLSKDSMPSANEEESDGVKEAIRACLRKAALVNYTRLSAYAKVQDAFSAGSSADSKLELVINLAELCIELIQQNEEHHQEALAWYNELMLEHTEIFWSLYAVDMDVALDCQAPDTWNSFALFQMLNNYLRMESPLRGGKFHKHLAEKFSPLVVRYIDLMESSIARSVDKGFAKESYMAVGMGCATSEDVFWKVRSIQSFIQDLHWPDDVFAEHVSTRLKLMAADMTEAIVSRVMNDLGKHLLTCSVDTSWVVAQPVCVMINVLCQADEQSQVLCTAEQTELEAYRYHSNIDQFIRQAHLDAIRSIVEKVKVVVDDLLKKTSRYDQGTLTSKFLTILKPKEEVPMEYRHFVSRNILQLHEIVKSEHFILMLEKAWWDKLCEQMCTWLIQRQEVALHPYQLKVLSQVLEPCRSLFEQEGLTADQLENDQYKAAYSKLQLEETMLNLNQPSELTRNIKMKSYERRTQESDGEYD